MIDVFINKKYILNQVLCFHALGFLSFFYLLSFLSSFFYLGLSFWSFFPLSSLVVSLRVSLDRFSVNVLV